MAGRVDLARHRLSDQAIVMRQLLRSSTQTPEGFGIPQIGESVPDVWRDFDCHESEGPAMAPQVGFGEGNTPEALQNLADRLSRRTGEVKHRRLVGQVEAPCRLARREVER